MQNVVTPFSRELQGRAGGQLLQAAQVLKIWTLPLFFLLGMALAFTPCVLPMVPILSSMVVGSGAS